MPIIASIGAMTSRAWGQFKAAVQQAVSGYLYLWGANDAGQFGNNSISDTRSQSPIQVSPDISASATPMVAGGYDFFIQVRGDGSLWSWGDGTQGQLGNSLNLQKSSPVQIGSGTDWSMCSAGEEVGGAIKSNGTLWMWGNGTNGTLGNNAAQTTSSPVQVGALTNWSKVSVGYYTVLSTKTDGTLWAWGFNNNGQIGDGSTVDKSSPVQIRTQTNWAQVSAGVMNSVAVKTDGTLWTWGRNSSGELGNGTTQSRSSPIQVGTLTNWASAYSGRGFGVLALKTDGTLWSWGENSYGQLGIGTTTNSSSPVQIGTLTTWSKILFNWGRSWAAVDTSGRLWAWGDNNAGQLGDGTAFGNDKSSPVQIGAQRTWLGGGMGFNSTSYVDKANNVFTVGNNASGALGINNTLDQSSPVLVGSQGYWGNTTSFGGGSGFSITKVNNSLWSWGNNANGRLGDGTTEHRSSPVQIGTLTNWKTVANGVSHKLAIKIDGTLWSWGLGTNGRLGAGNTVSRSSPIQIGTLTTWRQIAAGGAFSLGINTNNQLFAWGAGSSGQLASSSVIARSSPVQVGTLTTWRLVSAGSVHAAGIIGTSDLWVWGNNGQGRLGDNTIVSKSSPVQIAGAWATVSCSDSNTYGVKTDGSLWAWGDNGSGQIGDGTTGNRSSPVQIGTLTNWSMVLGSFISAFAIKNDGTLWAWGTNSSGDLGIGSRNDSSSPVQIGTLTTWSSINGIEQTEYGATNNNNNLYAWGSNVEGQLAQNSVIIGFRSSPVQLGTDLWKSAVYSNQSTIAVKPDGSLWTWGLNAAGQLGQNTNLPRSSPTQVGTLTNWNLISGGDGFFAAIKTDGTLWIWGDNGGGQIGNGTAAPVSSPVQIGTLTNWSSVSAGADFTLAVKTDGTLWAWGAGSNGKLGNGDTISRSSPIQIGTLTNWAKVSGSSGQCSYAIKTDGSLWAWGYNGFGQFGDGTTVDQSSPVQIGTLTNWSSVSGGTAVVSAIKTNGSLWGWGYNVYGQVGDGTTINKSSPVQVGTLTNWSYTSVSLDGTVIATKTDGTLWSWGNNSSGSIGDGTTVDKSSPVQIGSDSTWTTTLTSNFNGGAIRTT